MFPSISIAILAACLVASQAAVNAPQPTKPVDFYTAIDSQSSRNEISLISDSGSWRDAWQSYRSGDTIGNGTIKPAEVEPVVDFQHNYVVAVFAGPLSISGYQLVDSFKQGKALHVRIQPVPAQTPSGIKLLCYAVAFIVFPRQNAPIDVELPTADRSGTVTWQLATELDGS